MSTDFTDSFLGLFLFKFIRAIRIRAIRGKAFAFAVVFKV